MKNYKKILGSLLASFICIGMLGGCGSVSANSGSNTGETSKNETIVVRMGSSGLYTDMVGIIGDLMPEKYDVKLVTFDSNTGPAEACKTGEIEAFIYNHEPWLIQYNKSNGTDFAVMNHLYYGRSALYSNKYEKLDDLPNGCSIAISNDSVNMENNLIFLKDLGLITLAEKTDKESFLTTLDVVDNPKNIHFVEVEISYAVGSLGEVDAAICSSTQILSAGLNPEKFLAENKSKKDYPIGLTILSKDKGEAWVTEMLKVMSSDEFKTQFNKMYKGSLVLY